MERIVSALEKGPYTIGTAESCTGGLVGKMLTDIAGISAYYKGGIISYSNEVKESCLGVSAASLVAYGAVSEAVAKEMAEGARRTLKTDIGISTTGIAGPGGATETKPVGLVYMAVASPSGTEVFCHHFDGNRDSVREQAAKAILAHAADIVEKLVK